MQKGCGPVLLRPLTFHHATWNRELLAPSALLCNEHTVLEQLAAVPRDRGSPVSPGGGGEGSSAHLGQRCTPQLLPAQAILLPLLCLAQALPLLFFLFEHAAALASHLPGLPAPLTPQLLLLRGVPIYALQSGRRRVRWRGDPGAGSSEALVPGLEALRVVTTPCILVPLQALQQGAGPDRLSHTAYQESCCRVGTDTHRASNCYSCISVCK